MAKQQPRREESLEKLQQSALSSHGLATTHEQVTDTYMEGTVDQRVDQQSHP